MVAAVSLSTWRKLTCFVDATHRATHLHQRGKTMPNHDLAKSWRRLLQSDLAATGWLGPSGFLKATAPSSPQQPTLFSPPQARAWLHAALMLISVTNLTGCSASPSRNILGSYFPTWMICALFGLVGAVVLRVVLGKTSLDEALPVPAVVYLCAWIAVTLAIWLLWLG